MALPQRRGSNSIFPAPRPDETVQLNPPSLQWVAEPGAKHYRVTVRDDGGKTVVDAEVGRNVFRFDRPLAPGRYRWNVAVGAEERGEWTFTVPPDATPFLPPTAEQLLDALPAERPRHIHFREDAAELVRRHGPQLAILERNAKLAYPRGFMRYPDIYHADGWVDKRRAIDASRLFMDRDAVACALLWLLRRDRAAGEHARKALLTVCEWNPAGPASVAGQWGDEVGLSIVRTMPAIFDWVHDLLTTEERSWVVQTLRQHARQTHGLLLDGDFFGAPGNSHSGRLPGYLGELALVLAGEVPREEAATWLSYALDLYATLFPHYGGRDGGWAEGPFYGSSYTKWYLPFFLAVERLSGFSFMAKPFYRHLAEFFTHFATPGMEAHPFGDGHWSTAEEWPGFQAQNPFGIYADRFGPDLARQFSRRCDETIDHYELHLLDVIRPAPRAPLPPASRVGTDRSYVCRDTGLASLHTDLARPERDIAVYARASRYGTPSHQHADQGDFAVLVGGQALLVPTGSFGYQFGDSHHREWTQQTVAANCLLVDGVGQRKYDPTAVGVMTAEVERDGVSRLVMDLSAAYPMLARYTRTLVFDHAAGALTVTDDFAADRPVAIDWRLHANVPPERDGDAFTIRRERGSARFTVTGPAAAEYSVGDQYRYPNGQSGQKPSGRDRPPQYHMNWRFPDVPGGVIRAVFEITAE